MFPKPDDLFKQAFEPWEKQTADYWNGLLRDPAFLKNMWQGMEMGLQARQQWNEAAEETLAAWQLPTRAKQERLQHQLNRLQIALDDLNGRADRLMEQLENPKSQIPNSKQEDKETRRQGKQSKIQNPKSKIV